MSTTQIAAPTQPKGVSKDLDHIVVAVGPDRSAPTKGAGCSCSAISLKPAAGGGDDGSAGCAGDVADAECARGRRWLGVRLLNRTI